MKIKRIIKPGHPGTKKLLQQYGDNLICVRYRYDIEKKRMLKTIELIIENIPWQPNPQRIPKHKLVSLRIAESEIELRTIIKNAGGKWNMRKKVWRLSYQDVLHLNLSERIIE